MNKIRFRKFIKSILVILIVVFIFSGQTIAFARAGGGRSSSSHSSSSHSSTSHNSSSSSSTSKNPTIKEKNILENMFLLDATPIGLKDFVGIDKDYIWVHIKAKSKDYTVNEETNEVIKGKASSDVQFEEYWKFIRNEKRWVLDSIKQIDQVTDLDYF